jgi:hypothetical protein
VAATLDLEIGEVRVLGRVRIGLSSELGWIRVVGM